MHFGVGLPNRDAVLALRDRLATDGIELVGEWDEPDFVSVKCRDPDGSAERRGYAASAEAGLATREPLSFRLSRNATLDFAGCFRHQLRRATTGGSRTAWIRRGRRHGDRGFDFVGHRQAGLNGVRKGARGMRWDVVGGVVRRPGSQAPSWRICIPTATPPRDCTPDSGSSRRPASTSTSTCDPARSQPVTLSAQREVSRARRECVAREEAGAFSACAGAASASLRG
jgi:hypothetical protein